MADTNTTKVTGGRTTAIRTEALDTVHLLRLATEDLPGARRGLTIAEVKPTVGGVE